MIYLDHAATSPLEKSTLDAMLPYLCGEYGNPSAAYSLGTSARGALRKARTKIAELLGALPEEITFTSGGTESDNWALCAVAHMRQHGHIITSKIEHPAILRTCEQLEKQGFRITYLSVDANGMVDPASVEKAITSDTILISIMYANNEVGTIQRIPEIAAIAAKYKIPFHTDAVQAFGILPVSTDDGFTMLSASAHKFGGPKGVGFLYVHKKLRLAPFITGGGQELGLRSGTENVAGIVGMAAAAENAYSKDIQRIRALREELAEKLLANIDSIRRNSLKEACLPGHLNMSFIGIEAEQLLSHLDIAGICASGGSACSSGSRKPSHVLTAMGLSPKEIKGSVRFTLGAENTEEQIQQTVAVITEFMKGRN